MSSSKLFQPVRIGDLELAHRVVFAPCTRFRGTSDHIPAALAAEYYSQRASTPGTLIISEASVISPEAIGYPNVPGIYNDAQVEAWKKITQVVHAKGSYIYLQIWAAGRAAQSEVLVSEGSYPYVAPSPIPITGRDDIPRELTVPEIKQYVQWYARAARRAVNEAGFDGVEIHGANGYLIDQFTQDVTNHRSDEYGGSIENRSRFALEVVAAVVAAVGEEKTGFRVGPWTIFQDVGMAEPRPTFSFLVQRLREWYPSLAYLHVIEPRIDGEATRDAEAPAGQSNDFLRDIWAPRPFIRAGGFVRDVAIEAADKYGDIIAFGRPFIANPDLPLRLKRDIPLTRGDRSTYYLFGDTSPKGYTDYPFAAV